MALGHWNSTSTWRKHYVRSFQFENWSGRILGGTMTWADVPGLTFEQRKAAKRRDDEQSITLTDKKRRQQYLKAKLSLPRTEPKVPRAPRTPLMLPPPPSVATSATPATCATHAEEMPLQSPAVRDAPDGDNHSYNRDVSNNASASSSSDTSSGTTDSSDSSDSSDTTTGHRAASRGSRGRTEGTATGVTTSSTASRQLGTRRGAEPSTTPQQSATPRAASCAPRGASALAVRRDVNRPADSQRLRVRVDAQPRLRGSAGSPLRKRARSAQPSGVHKASLQ